MDVVFYFGWEVISLNLFFVQEDFSSQGLWEYIFEILMICRIVVKLMYLFQ